MVEPALVDDALRSMVPGETVRVDVAGPGGYTAECQAVVASDGAWSCQVVLWNSLLVVGTHSYTATALTSGVIQSGSFSDAAGDVSIDFVAAAPFSPGQPGRSEPGCLGFSPW